MSDDDIYNLVSENLQNNKYTRLFILAMIIKDTISLTSNNMQVPIHFKDSRFFQEIQNFCLLTKYSTFKCDSVEFTNDLKNEKLSLIKNLDIKQIKLCVKQVITFFDYLHSKQV
jgi:hypothetical protein